MKEFFAKGPSVLLKFEICILRIPFRGKESGEETWRFLKDMEWKERSNFPPPLLFLQILLGV